MHIRERKPMDETGETLSIDMSLGWKYLHHVVREQVLDYSPDWLLE